jgi:hypothetical protein
VWKCSGLIKTGVLIVKKKTKSSGSEEEGKKY